jgi:hypothetical protein
VAESRRRTLVAEFAGPAPLVEAVRMLRAAGAGPVEVFSPFGLEALDSLLPARRRRAPMAALLGGLAILVAAHLSQRWAAVSLYPFDIGGRPLASDPAFAPNTLEMGILAAVVAAVIALLAGCRLPRPYDPVFALPGFERTTQDRFLLRVLVAPEAVETTRQTIDRAGALHLTEAAP